MTTRFRVPLEPAPPLRQLIAPALELAHLAIVVGAPLLFAWLVDGLPSRVPLHFDLAGQPDRFGSPSELWLFAGILAGLYGLHWLVLVAVAHERRAVPDVPPAHAAGYLTLVHERRRLLVRLVETLMLVTNAGLAALWLGLALSLWHDPEATPLAPLLAAPALILGIVVSIAAFLPRLTRVQDAMRTAGGDPTLGTRADGWHAGGLVYASRQDPALFVPRRLGIGQTINLAHPGAWVFLGLVVVLPTLLLLLVAR